VSATRVALVFGVSIGMAAVAAAGPRTRSDTETGTPGNGAGSSSSGSALLSKEDLAKRYPEIPVSSIRDAILPGFYEVLVGSNIYYVTTDGRYMIRGDLTDLSTKHNVSEARRAENRAALIASIDAAKEIVFSPPSGEPKYRVTIFTDVDCAYCRKFHSQIGLVNALGIEVRYVSYPRTGPNTESWAKAENVWCAADQRTALTQAKLGAAVSAVPGCKDTPIAEEYELGRSVGLTGTPGVYADNGVELGGYLPPDELLKALEKAYSKN
jgi:thiol:disulfide interchange protein DsbC